MVTDQLYRRALSRERAMGELFACSGSQLDPRLVREFCRTAMTMVADLGFLLAVDGVELTPADFWQLLGAEGFDTDLSAAVADSAALRERFRCVALTGLMLLRNPLGRRRRVGGRDWAERQLFEQVRTELKARGLMTYAGTFTSLATAIAKSGKVALLNLEWGA